MKRFSYLIALVCAGAYLSTSSISAVTSDENGGMASAAPPKMTVVFVVDQLSAHYIEKTRSFLKGGIGTLLKEGIEYTNAFYDASPPSTAHGHTLLTTGTYGALHGIIANSWRTADLSHVHCDQDDSKDAAVFAPDGNLRPYGKSAKNMLVDNLSDQLMLHSYPHARNTVWALSMKSRAAILMAGKMGKAAWLDEKTKSYTTSKAFFKELPEWLSDFNTKHQLGSQEKVTWKPFYPLASAPYAFDLAGDYSFSAYGKPFINKTHDLTPAKAFKMIYEKTPQATRDFFKLAIDCVNANYKDGENERFILYVNVATFDKVGHAFGCYSRETLDTLYHIDDQIKKFMEFLYTKVPKEDILFVLTGDHGVQPIPEMARKMGYTEARRYLGSTIIEDLNKLVYEKHGINKLVRFVYGSQFYLDMELLKALSPAKKQAIMTTIKKHLMSLPGIRKAWTFEELEKTMFEPYDLDRFIKKELHRGRSGQIFYSTNPYTGIYQEEKGAKHGTPYGYDTRVPLVFHQAGRFPKLTIAATRYMTQVSPTLAALLNVPRPSASVATVLPEVLP